MEECSTKSTVSDWDWELSGHQSFRVRLAEILTPFTHRDTKTSFIPIMKTIFFTVCFTHTYSCTYSTQTQSMMCVFGVSPGKHRLLLLLVILMLSSQPAVWSFIVTTTQNSSSCLGSSYCTFLIKANNVQKTCQLVNLFWVTLNWLFIEKEQWKDHTFSSSLFTCKNHRASVIIKGWQKWKFDPFVWMECSL